MNPFEVLQIRPNASPEEVKAAYHSLAKKWHPDKFSGAEKQMAEEKFRKITQAFTAIKKGEAEVPKTNGPAASSRPGTSSAGKSPGDWLADAKSALNNKQYENALSLSQFCFNYPILAEEARLVYAKAIEVTSNDTKAKARAFEEVLRLNPNNKEAVVKLADLYLTLDMPTRAASMNAKARALGVVPKSGPSKPPAQGAKKSVQQPSGIFDKVLGLFKSKN